MSTRQRCAIYTRKSSDEGLEQDFNSLSAQREACEAYIKSQAHAGWQTLTHRYDDGGYSGATLDRPALQALLAAVRAGHVDIVVLYKIDRLSRSLADFARLAELFDAHKVSFVSITQPFNTTTSMGRLVLHVLLSFAQFEREVTAERIRDKLALSKRKGLWMGGSIPIGYAAHARTLVIEPAEAKTIQSLYRLFLELGTVRAVQAEATRRGLRTRVRTLKTGRTIGGDPFSRGHLYRILTSPIYAGRIPHKENSYPGLHPALIDQETWEAVQARIRNPDPRPRATRPNGAVHCLAGLVVDGAGMRYRSTQSIKSGRRYRYYTHPALIEQSPAPRIAFGRLSGPRLEDLVITCLQRLLANRVELMEAIGIDGDWDWGRVAQRAQALRAQITPGVGECEATLHILISAVEVVEGTVTLRVSRRSLRIAVGLPDEAPTDSAGPSDIILPIPLRRSTGLVRWVLEPAVAPPAPRIDPALIRTLRRAQDWWAKLEDGSAVSVEALARAERLSPSLVTRIVRLAFLAPDIVDALVGGHQPRTLTARSLMNRPPLPLSWDEQRRVLGFTAHINP